MTDERLEEMIGQAAGAIQEADALLITAGAGMGVDSGLPDFRGQDGFWRAYPPLAKLGLDFVEMANPEWFKRDPALAWGFYGHRLNLYRRTEPHAGFALMKAWAEAKPEEWFVFTSNVDEHFQKAGFNAQRVLECHGSIHRLQCPYYCEYATWSAEDIEIVVDEETLRATGPLPTCPRCGNIARPNLLMFNDPSWVSDRYDGRQKFLFGWSGRVVRQGSKLTVIECGAGRAIPSVRNLSEKYAAIGATLVRINPRESFGPPGTISIPLSALDALTRIDDRIRAAGGAT